MAQRLAIIGFIIAAVVAIFAFGQQQQAVQQAKVALSAQAAAQDQATSAAGQVEVASAAQAQAESAQATAANLADAAGTAQAQAQASAVAAAADAQLAGTAQARSEATSLAQMTEIAGTVTAVSNEIGTQQAHSQDDLATAGAQLIADATDEVIFAQALGTATAQVDLAQFAASAAEDDRAAALAQARAAETQIAQLQSDLATAQFQLTGLPPVPTSAFTAQPPPTSVPTAVPPTLPPQTEATAVQGDSDLTQQFTSKDGSIQFKYPSGWLVAETSQGPIAIVSSQDVGTRTQNGLTTGQVEATVLIIPGSGITGKTGGTSTPGDVADSLVTSIAGQSNSPFTLEAATEVALGSQTIGRSQGTDGDNDVLLLVVDAGNDLFGVLVGRTASGERDQYEPTLRAILQTIQIMTSTS
ncbi:MAG: hypothetical protein ABI690_20225 [Chloroflexota bacterium]